MTAAAGREAVAAWLAERGLSFDERQWGLLERFLAELRAAAAKTNLTAGLDEDSWWRRHIADGLAALPALRAKLGPAPTVVDLGAGAGFVGVALKVAWPQATVTLLESSYRKFQFLNLAAARLGLKGLRVEWRRAGQAGGTRFDAVLERAVAPLPEAAALAMAHVEPGGLFVAWASEPPGAGGALGAALERLGAALEEVVAYRLPGEDRERRLVFIRRGGST